MAKRIMTILKVALVVIALAALVALGAIGLAVKPLKAHAADPAHCGCILDDDA